MMRVHPAWILAFLAASRAATAQDPSDAIFDQSQIRTFRLSMSSTDWSAIVNADGETWRRANFEWVGPNGTEAVGGVGVKASGHGTLTRREKQSIRISFNEFEFDALKRRWRNVNRLKLDSMEGNVDHSMSRDRIAFWLMNTAGNAAPRLAHCKLYVNGAYKGIYIVVEPVRKDFLRYRWGTDDDGNLFEQDGNNSSAYDWRGTDQNQYVPNWFVQENADAPNNYSDLVGLIDTVNNRQGDDRRTRLQSIIDYPVFIRHLAVTTVYGDGDDIAHWGGGWCNNHFWYHHENGKMRIIKWDPDASQGRFYTNADQPLGYRWDQTDMLDWIAGDSVVWNDYKAAVAALLNGPATQVQSRIDSIYNQIRNEVYNDPLKSFSNTQYDSGKNFLKDWWNRRINYLRTQVSVNNAAFVSQSVPAAMTAGQTYTVTVRMKNTGTTTWGTGYALGSQNPADNTTWDGDGRIPLATGETIAPNAEKSFTWTLTAPATPGTYNFQWRMRQSGVEWFGATSPNVAVVVSAPPATTPPDDADFVSQTVPSTMTAGQTYSVTVVFKNVGTATWTSAAGYKLTSRNATGNTTWGMSTVALAGADSIAPNQNKTFTWTVTAPTTAGTYNFQWSLMKGTTSFGDTSPNVAVVVSAPPSTPAYAAEFVSQTVPGTMVAGQTYSVTVRMKNVGSATWTDVRDDRLGSQNPQDNTTWGMNRVDLAAGTSVAPGQTATYTWTVTAPAAAGTYNFQWRMRQSLDDLWYGPLTPNVAVTVTAPTTTPPPTTGTDLAEYVSQTVVTTMTAGQEYSVTIRLKNVGTTTWTEAAKYRLTSRDPRDNTTWGVNRVYLAPTDSIAPGQTHTFMFDVTAPSTAGTYVFRWSMVDDDGAGVFEARTPATSITVAAATPTPTPTPAPTPPPTGGGGSTPIAESSKDNGESGLDPVFDKCSGSIGGGLAGPLLAGLALLLLAARRRT